MTRVCYRGFFAYEGEKSIIVGKERANFQIQVSKALAEDIANEVGEKNSCLVAILIATIYLSRGLNIWGYNRPSDEMISNALVALLKRYYPEDMLDALIELKWYEIKEIINADDPLIAYQQMLYA